ncbi:hypothetical protein OIDMADRAFT_100402 [Oidiodendron maius Zn]|uniref:C2H2-type domain-containing protein n=1 Tax=Oidiodendron maius (strain Zn) TaxID=913774 RepID=A0A0C3E334_OIDMZ|nr:hypothetical protein OIDMADRAFT_100402 [Oidiodendron maius Zn]
MGQGCGAGAYSRAEHLSRHQLNHNPKQIYKCDLRNCGRIFVREDLLSRHKERHSNSDKEYQWQCENHSRTEGKSAVDASLSSLTYLPNSTHSPPITETEDLAPGPPRTDHFTDHHLRTDMSQSQLEARNFGLDSSVPEQRKTPKAVGVLMDEDIIFTYNMQNQLDSNGIDCPGQDLDTPHLYDSCALWQDELAISGSMPDFGGQGYNRSPFTMSDDFISFLFEVHKPTFSPENTPDLLLIAVMMIGASCSNKGGNLEVIRASVDMGNILARHLRWEIFRDDHFHPASLWVFQTLLLLEVYEKMFSTRYLHERAHIHHATTITLLRRDIALTERSILDSPSRYQENPAYSKSGLESPPNDSWEHWITREATRRVAFAAFMIDATHATMFGHSTIMVTHEIRCLLPCDDALWFATSATEVGRIKSALQANHIKPISFLEGLQRTLNGQEVPTNEFGKGILMCGLLSVSWYMNQRDLQIKSLGVDPETPSRGMKWEKSITRAFEIWKQSCEKAAVNNSNDRMGYNLDKDLVLESRIALYHLARISMYSDIVECQIFAGAKRVLGRAISKLDFESAQRRIRNIWAPTADARTAAFYAIRYLCTVLLPKASTDEVYPPNHDFVPDYAARKSIIPSRCWVLYYAGLVVWSYSYAIDGPMTALVPSGSSLENYINDMNSFLLRVDRIKTPDEVVHHRLNGCGGMLKVLRYIFRQADWELLLEAADLLTNCIKLIEKRGG